MPDPIPTLLEQIHADLEDLMRIMLSMSDVRSHQCEEVCSDIAARLGLPDTHPDE